MSLSVKVEGVTKSFKDRQVLRDVSCSFPEGRISVILGPNGSGKTTLMRAISRLEAPDSGRVEYLDNGEAQGTGPALMRRMTLIAQDPVLFNMTVAGNVAYGLRLRGLPSGEINERVGRSLDAAGVSRLSGARARTLSGGEAQRTALARAFALRPELLLLDEPSANLDPEGVALMESLVRRMKEEFGTTVIMVTHNLFQARRMANEAFLIYGGRLVENGPAAEFFGSPRNELTREFLSGEIIF